MLYCGLTPHSPKALVVYIKHICLLALSERGQFPPFKGFSPLVPQSPLSRQTKSYRMHGLLWFALCTLWHLSLWEFPFLWRYSLLKCHSGVIMVRSSFTFDSGSLNSICCFTVRANMLHIWPVPLLSCMHASFGKGSEAERLQSGRKWGKNESFWQENILQSVAQAEKNAGVSRGFMKKGDKGLGEERWEPTGETRGRKLNLGIDRGGGGGSFEAPLLLRWEENQEPLDFLPRSLCSVASYVTPLLSLSPEGSHKARNKSLVSLFRSASPALSHLICFSSNWPLFSTLASAATCVISEGKTFKPLSSAVRSPHFCGAIEKW